MSEPTRYTAVGNGVVRTDPEGLLIAYGHYLELKAEVERLTAFTTRTIIPNELLQADVERLTNNCDYLDKKLDEELDKSAMLCGQVERLTKAGDAMVDMVDWEVSYERRKNLEADWNAAKEGKQP